VDDGMETGTKECVTGFTLGLDTGRNVGFAMGTTLESLIGPTVDGCITTLTVGDKENAPGLMLGVEVGKGKEIPVGSEVFVPVGTLVGTLVRITTGTNEGS